MLFVMCLTCSCAALGLYECPITSKPTGKACSSKFTLLTVEVLFCIRFRSKYIKRYLNVCRYNLVTSNQPISSAFTVGITTMSLSRKVVYKTNKCRCVARNILDRDVSKCGWLKFNEPCAHLVSNFIQTPIKPSIFPTN